MPILPSIKQAPHPGTWQRNRHCWERFRDYFQTLYHFAWGTQIHFCGCRTWSLHLQNIMQTAE